MISPVAKLAFWLGKKFSFNALMITAMLLMFLAGAFFGALVQEQL